MPCWMDSQLCPIARIFPSSMLWKRYPRPHGADEPVFPHFVLALTAHRFPETIPVMAQFVHEGLLMGQAQAFLREITGVDQGDDPKAWITWYEVNETSIKWTEKNGGVWEARSVVQNPQ